MRTTIAGLSVDVVQGRGASAAIILCHGFGAPGDDLVPLAGELVRAAPSLDAARFHFPHAPLSLWGEDSRAWWLIDISALQRAAGDPAALAELRRHEPHGMAAARAALHRLVLDVATAMDVPLSRVVLGGFSQGAMIATDVALRLEEPPAALVCLSGTLLVEDRWRTLARARAGLPVFQAHGRQDPILPFHAAEALHHLFDSAGLAVDWMPFDGGHTITGDELRRLGEFLHRGLTA